MHVQVRKERGECRIGYNKSRHMKQTDDSNNLPLTRANFYYACRYWGPGPWLSGWISMPTTINLIGVRSGLTFSQII